MFSMLHNQSGNMKKIWSRAMFMLRFPSQVFSGVLLSPSKTETNKNELKQITQASPSVCLWSF